MAMNTPFVTKGENLAPMSSIDDGFNDLVYQTVEGTGAGRCALIKLLLAEEKGNYFR